jgi:hypothetical protein
MSLNEMAGSGFASKYTVNKPSTAYVAAVTQVKTATKGTVISKAPSKALTVSVPKAVSSPQNFLEAVLQIGAGNVLTGSRENTLEGITAFSAADVVTTPAYDIRTGYQGGPTTEPVSHYITDVIDTAKEKDPEQKAYWEGNSAKDAVKDAVDSLGLPDFSGLGDTIKWVIIGGAVLVGGLILSKIIGGNK